MPEADKKEKKKEKTGARKDNTTKQRGRGRKKNGTRGELLRNNSDFGGAKVLKESLGVEDCSTTENHSDGIGR